MATEDSMLHDWLKEPMSAVEEAVGLDMYKCKHCPAKMNLGAYTVQGVPDIHYEQCPNKNAVKDLLVF